jgi:outer membrane protein assembly factor BamB
MSEHSQKMPKTTLFLGLCVLLASSSFAEWKQFRGPTNDGIYPAPADGGKHGFVTEWSEDKNVIWKTPVPGRAWSTPVVVDDEVWLSNATEDGSEMSAICLDRKTGKKIHEFVLFKNDDPEALSNKVNGYGSCSPTIDEERVYFHFGSYGTAALDRKTAKVIWQRRDLPCRHFRGPGSSVVLYKETLILTMDGIDVQYLTALDRKTGKTVWRTDRTTDYGDVEANGKIRGDGDFRKAYTTPNFVKVGDVTQLVSCGAKACYGYNANTGKELWKVTYKGFSNAPTPAFVGNELAIINTGLGKARVQAVRLDGRMEGDITKSHVEWDIFKRMPARSSPLVVDGKIYLLSESGILSLVDAKTGEIEKFVSLKGGFSSSGIYADGLLYFPSEEGKVVVVKPGPDLEVVSTNELDDGFMASPALAGSSIFLRSKSHLYCIGRP